MKKIMFCGGGSAGHVIPNVALMRELKDRYDVEYMGTDGIEYSIIRAEGFRFHIFFSFSAADSCSAPSLAIFLSFSETAPASYP